jgi:hypothetical protein
MPIHSTQTYPATQAYPSCRIIHAPTSKDGWIAKTIPEGKVAFIANLSSTIQELAAGQVWSYALVYSKPVSTKPRASNYIVIQLIAKQ